MTRLHFFNSIQNIVIIFCLKQVAIQNVQCHVRTGKVTYEYIIFKPGGKMKKKIHKRKMIQATAVGLSIVMSPLLARHNVIDTYAQVALTTDEENAINSFLATQPVNGDTTNIGPVAVTQPAIAYTFPGVNNYTSFFQSRAQKTHLDEDYTFTVRTSGPYNSKTVKVKDWSNVDVYKVYTADPTITVPTLYIYGNVVYARKVTLIDQSDNSEFTLNNVVMEVKDSTGQRRFGGYLNYDSYFADLPIEDADPRFSIDTAGAEAVVAFRENAYWQFFSTIDEKVPYDTIVRVDENLKTGDVVEDVAGQLGDKMVKFQFQPEKDHGANTYRNYTADDIYADLKTKFNNTNLADAYTLAETHAWGHSWVVGARGSSPTNRVLRIGIDYTHYVTEDNTTLLPTKYGLHGVETISGYQYVTTRHETNGDRIHVYKPVPTPVTPPTPVVPPITPVTPPTVVVPPATPVTPPTTPTVSTTPATPKTGDAGLFASTFMLFTGMIGSIGAFITKKKNS